MKTTGSLAIDHTSAFMKKRLSVFDKNDKVDDAAMRSKLAVDAFQVSTNAIDTAYDKAGWPRWKISNKLIETVDFAPNSSVY